ncbi:MAG: class I SAM-dependent methyltransferase [Promethearchaeota archaeon]
MERYAELPKFLRRPLWRIWHTYLVSRDKNFDIKFMNYGFCGVNGEFNPLNLKPEDEPERYCINLYHHDVYDVDLEGKDLLEIGCGRGGGASYISRYLKTKSFIGLDLSKKAIKFCNTNYDIPGLSFVRGKAEDLPFEDEQFDAVVNVESSRCYADMQGFLNEVHRTLKPGGHLLFSDMRTEEDNLELRNQFSEASFTTISEKDILQNVIQSLELDSDRRIKLAQEKTPKFLHKSCAEFSGVKGSRRFELFADGTMHYYSYILQKA